MTRVSGADGSRVAEAMQPARALVHVDAGQKDAMARLEQHEENCLIVLDGDEVVGLLPRHLLEAAAARGEETLVSDLMLPPTAYCRPDDSASAVSRRLNELGRLNALVIDADDQVVGIVDADALGADTGLGSGAAAKMRHEAVESRHAGDPAGNRAMAVEPGDLQVYSERPHLKPDRWR